MQLLYSAVKSCCLRWLVATLQLLARWVLSNTERLLRLLLRVLASGGLATIGAEVEAALAAPPPGEVEVEEEIVPTYEYQLEQESGQQEQGLDTEGMDIVWQREVAEAVARLLEDQERQPAGSDAGGGLTGRSGAR